MKGTGKATDESQRRSERSVSPIVGIILLFGMVAIAATVIAISGMALVDSLQSDAAEKQGVNELNQLDHTLRTQGFDNDDVRSFVLSDDLGDYEMNADGRLSITANGQFGTNETVVNTTLRTVELETDDGQTVAYQGGGIFSGDAEGSAVRSDPALQYQTQTEDGQPTRRLSFSIIDLQGDVGTGENVVNGQSRAQSRNELENIRYVTGVEIRVHNSTYHHGWNTFLTDEFGAGAVDHFPSNQTVVVNADIDHERPFTQYIDVYPTIYGGLHAESSDPVTLTDTELTVDGYDSRYGEGYNASNATTDLFTVDTADELQLQPQADIDGLPISNGDVRGQPGADVSPFAFYAGTDTSPSGTDVLTAELNSSFEPVKSITDKIDGQAVKLLQKEGTQLSPSTDLEPGMYYSNNSETLSGTIDTKSGESVHIGVDDELSLQNVDVNGTGQVHIYATGDLTLSNVSVPDDRASALWIYGTETANVTVSDTVQGVVYAPGSGSLTLKDGAEVYGSLVGGEPTFEGDAAVHFDRSLRTALPLSEDDLEQEWSSSEPNELDVSFVLDSTGSMEDTDPDDLIKPATQNAIGMLEEPYHRAGVYEFDTSGRALHEISGDLAAVNDSVEANEDGGTNISTGIERGLDGHAAVEEAGREKHMILMTDGKNEPYWWCGPESECKERADEATRQQARRAAANNVTVWTIAFSDDADSELMEYVANETGGESRTITDASQIEGVMEEFLDDVIDEEETVELAVNLDFEANPRANHEAFDVQTFTFNIDSG